MLYASIALSFDELDAASGSELAIMNLLDAEWKVAKMTMTDDLGNAFFNDGSDSIYPHGVRHIVNTGRTLGDINSSNFSWWDANVYNDTTNYTKTNMTDPTSAYYVLKLLRKAWRAARHNNDHPDIISISGGWHDILEEEIQPMTQYGSKDIRKAAVDFADFDYKGLAPFVEDDLNPDGELFMLNSNWMNLYIHKERDFDIGPFQKPVNKLARVAQVTLKCQFASNGPRMLSRIRAATSIES
jgi:hypothetical protein